MRIVPLVLLAAACTPTSALTWQSSLGLRTNGVVLHGDGDIGHAGMAGTNCPFETTNGSVTGDYPLPGEGEDVQDVGTTHLGTETVLLVLDGAVWLLEKSTGSYETETWAPPAVEEARIWSGGLVALGGGAVTWSDGASASVVGASGLAVDPTTGTAVVGGDPVVVATPDGTVATEASGDLLAFDPETSATFVATNGGDIVFALETDGAVRWTAVVPGRVRALTHSGERAAAAVVLELPSGAGAVTYLDAWTGEERGWLDTPQPASDAAHARDGSMLALVSPHDVHFYSVGALP